MKVALLSNSPWCGTGYGAQAAQVLPRFAYRYGNANVAMLSLYGLQGGPLTLNGIRHYPMGHHPYSDDVAPAHALHFFDADPGVLITLFDVWPFRNDQWKQLPLVASWVPIDHIPVPPGVIRFLREFNVAPIAMSKFGRDWLVKAGFDPLYVPHAIERATMKPTPTLNGATCRSLFGIGEDRYVVGMVSANKGVLPNRKSFPEAFRAFSVWKDGEHERKPLLYVHADWEGSTGGIDLHRVAHANGLRVGEDVVFTDPYAMRMPFQPEAMAALFSSFDVLLQPSMGEGFGIPALEAQACGVPVIGTDFSAQPEVIEVGWVVHGEPFLDLAQDSWLVTPHVPSIVQALRECEARSADQVADDAARAQAHADLYDADRVWREHWLPTLDALETMLPSAAPIRVAPEVAA